MKVVQITAWLRPSFPTNWPLYNIKRGEDYELQRSRRAAFLEFYPLHLPGVIPCTSLGLGPRAWVLEQHGGANVNVQIQKKTLPPLFQREESAF